jgi:hypothetical protein
MATGYKSKSRKTTNLVPADLRAFAAEHNLPGAGSRGRMSKSLYVAYLAANPKTARAIAAEVGVALKPRARLTEANLGPVVDAIR